MRFHAYTYMAGLLLAATAFSPCTAFANAEAAIKADTRADFDAVVAIVKNEMVPGGRYEFVSGGERHTIDSNLAEMQSLFDRFGTVAAMDKDTKFKLYVDQENVNAILTHRDDRRMVCVSERPIGSLIPKRVCRTYGAVERDRQNTQEQLVRSARPGYHWQDSSPGGATGGMSGTIKPGSVH
jgi:uncharacterized protein YlbG (UPF0298 family)